MKITKTLCAVTLCAIWCAPSAAQDAVPGQDLGRAVEEYQRQLEDLERKREKELDSSKQQMEKLRSEIQELDKQIADEAKAREARLDALLQRVQLLEAYNAAAARARRDVSLFLLKRQEVKATAMVDALAEVIVEFERLRGLNDQKLYLVQVQEISNPATMVPEWAKSIETMGQRVNSWGGTTNYNSLAVWGELPLVGQFIRPALAVIGVLNNRARDTSVLRDLDRILFVTQVTGEIGQSTARQKGRSIDKSVTDQELSERLRLLCADQLTLLGYQVGADPFEQFVRINRVELYKRTANAFTNLERTHLPEVRPNEPPLPTDASEHLDAEIRKFEAIGHRISSAMHLLAVRQRLELAHLQAELSDFLQISASIRELRVKARNDAFNELAERYLARIGSVDPDLPALSTTILGQLTRLRASEQTTQRRGAARLEGLLAL
jgi:Skp family chaperone for outer membrane proteins